MKIALNLATRPFADLGPSIKRLRMAMGVLAFVAILLGVGLHAIRSTGRSPTSLRSARATPG
jgi:type IV pilus assembly protein PilN